MTRRDNGTLRKRGLIWFVRFYDADGVRHEVSTGTGVEREARAFLAQLRRDLRDGTWKPGSERTTLTLAHYLTEWLDRRRVAGARTWRNEDHYLRTHVIPTMGKLPLAEVTRVHVRDLVARLSATVSKRTRKVFSARTVKHVYEMVRVALSDAVLDGLIPASPCTLRGRRGELPRKADNDPAARAAAVYTRHEAARLISHVNVPADRHALYALMLLGGLRISEACGRRWRDYDADAQPLGRLTVASQADGASASRSTKTGDVREVPVVPVLAGILDEWRVTGFPMLFGRRPEADDPIVPSRADLRGKLFRVHTYEPLRDDLKRLGLRRVPWLQHAMRATFLSLLAADGANMAIAMRATHRAPGDVVSGYIRVGWPDLCREIGKLTIERQTGADEVVTVGAVGAEMTHCAGGSYGGSLEKQGTSAAKMVGDAGFEVGAKSGPCGPSPAAQGRFRAGSVVDDATDTGRVLPRKGRRSDARADAEVQTGAHPPVSAGDLTARVATLTPDDAARVAALLTTIERERAAPRVNARRSA